MAFRTSRRMAGVHMPPIHPMMNRVREMRKRGETVYSMAQAVPWYRPPEQAVTRFRRRLSDPEADFYSPDPGFLSVRTALAEEFAQRRDIHLDPESELHLTCGASQAFLGALLSVTDPGDRVVVPEPYYFDHIFATGFSGLRTVTVPMSEGTDWEMPMELLEREVPGSAALILVNPGNPTGSALSLEKLRRLVELTEAEDCALIVDETYERFNFTGSSWHPWQGRRPAHVITLGSFSKSFSLSGWRIGYLFGSAEVLEEALKVQDSVVICPPTPSQFLLEECLKETGWVERRSEQVLQRLNACREAMKTSIGLEWREAGGGFFTLAAGPPGTNGYSLAEHLLDRYSIATIPGEAFGPSGASHVRISFGCLSDAELEPAMKRLASVDLSGFSP